MSYYYIKYKQLLGRGHVSIFGRFPILAPHRIKNLGVKILNKAGLFALLNGRSWEQLLLFLDKALTYRQLIIEEFSKKYS